MVKLTKPIARELKRLREKGKPVIMEILPDVEIITFRPKGCREPIAISIAAVYYQAARIGR